jgi:hypothetical protein
MPTVVWALKNFERLCGSRSSMLMQLSVSVYACWFSKHLECGLT